MKNLLIQSFRKFAKKKFIINSSEKITYNDFYFRTLYLIKYFNKKGIKENDKILIKIDNSLNYLLILNACFLGGFTACPLDPTTKKRRVMEIKKTYGIKFSIESNIKVKKVKTKNEIINYNDTNFLIIGSSNKQGDLQGIMLKCSSILKSAKSFSKLANYNSKTRVLHCLPMFYMGGILDTFFACIINGSKIILNPRFSVMSLNNFWDLPIKNNSNILFLTPSIISMITSVYKNPSSELLNHLKNYKMIISTGSLLDDKIRDNFFKVFKKKIFVCYGATELSGPIALQKNNFCLKNKGGKVSSENKIKILNKKNKNIILIKSPYLMDGFLTKKGFKKLSVTKDGYFNTGDKGSYSNGILKVDGTERKIIKRGGELIHLSFIENITKKCKLVSNARAYGKKDITSGEELFLSLSLKKGVKKKNFFKIINNHFSKYLRTIEIPKQIFISKKI